MDNSKFYESLKGSYIDYAEQVYSLLTENVGMPDVLQISWSDFGIFDDIGWEAEYDSLEPNDSALAFFKENGIQCHDNLLVYPYQDSVAKIYPVDLVNELVELSEDYPEYRGFFLNIDEDDIEYVLDPDYDVFRYYEPSECEHWVEFISYHCVADVREALVRDKKLSKNNLIMQGDDGLFCSVNADTLQHNRTLHGYEPSEGFIIEFLKIWIDCESTIDDIMEEYKSVFARVVS
ncbi:MAG: hypothetical protein GY754_38920 [bacterium]|nr:hypothetical protein [bacterium]